MTLCFPSSFMLVAAMNPCKCGFYGDAKRECRCTPAQIQHYLGKISGPLLDRIDIHVEAKTVPFKELRGETAAESSAEIRERVERGRAVQQGFTIADAIATVPEGVDDSGERTLEMAFGRMGLSARTDSESGADSGGPRRRGARFGQARRGSGAVPDLDRNLELAESRDGCELGRARRRHPRVRTQSARQTATAEAAWLCR
jgi:hypothetical protein